MKRRYHIIYVIMIAIVFVLFIMAFLFTPMIPDGSDSSVIEPVSIRQLNEYEREFTFDVSNLSAHETDIAFFTKHQYIEIYGDHELIYEYTDNGGIWGHTNGVAWNFLDIPYGTSTLSVHLTAAYDNVVSDVPTFLIGDKLNIFQQIYQKSIPSLLISLLIVIFGIVLIIYWIFLARRFDIGKSLLYLGFFSALIGLYLLNDTEAAIIGIHHRIASILITYLTLMTLGPTGIIFIREFFGTVENVVWKILCVLPVISLTACSDIMIVTFDLNNLKKCNDNLGHAEGDTYILSAAKIIKEVFSPYGSCYRIGGDEFCVMIKNASKCPIEMLTDLLAVKEKEFNETNQVIDMHISYGYAIFDDALDSDLEKTRARADVFMYEHKRKSKETPS